MRARSAGSRPKPLHPHAVKVMAERGIDISTHKTKHLDRFVRTRFDRVVTLCDKLREVCPEFPSQPELVHWSIPDPAQAAAATAFEEVATELETRIRFLLPLLTQRRSFHGHR